MARKLEWIGGRFQAPAVITGEDVPYRPELSLWLEVDGPIVGMDMLRPGERFAPTITLLRKSMAAPMDGPPRKPARVRVADAELAGALRAEFGDAFEVVVGPTPEFDEVLASLADHLGAGGGEPPGYLALAGVTPEQVASLFRASARLYRAAPWKLVPSDQDLLTLDIEALGVRGQVVSVIGAMGESLGVIVFQSRADFERFLSEVEHGERTHGAVELPAYLSLNFEPLTEVPVSMRKAAASRGWEVAGPKAFPVVLAARGMVGQDPSSQQLATLEALAHALADLAAAQPRFGDALAEGRGLDQTFEVEANGQRVSVRLSAAPRPAASAPAPGKFDIRAEQRDEDGNIDEAWAEAFEGELLERFAASPEARALPEGPTTVDLVLSYGRGYLNETLRGIGAPELRELLFELFPRKVSCDPREAPAIVAELRAFWGWAKREFGLETAEECLAVLRPGAEQALERALWDPAKFGMAKSMVMGGMKAGYDTTTKEGMDRYMADVNAGKVPFPELGSVGGLPVPVARERQAKAKQDKKKKRKAQRSSRKRNR